MNIQIWPKNINERRKRRKNPKNDHRKRQNRRQKSLFHQMTAHPVLRLKHPVHQKCHEKFEKRKKFQKI